MFKKIIEAIKKKKDKLLMRLIVIIKSLIKIINILVLKKINESNINKIFQYTGIIRENLENINNKSECEKKLDNMETNISELVSYTKNLENKHNTTIKKNELKNKLIKIKEKIQHCNINKCILCYCIKKLEEDLENASLMDELDIETIIIELEKLLQISVTNNNTKKPEKETPEKEKYQRTEEKDLGGTENKQNTNNGKKSGRGR